MNPHQASLQLSYNQTKDKLYSVKIRVSYQGTRIRFALPEKKGVILKPSDFNRILNWHKNKPKNTGDDIRNLYRDKIKPHLERAERILAELKPFSFEAFKAAFQAPEGQLYQKTDAIAMLDHKAERLKAEDRVGNSKNYTTTARSFERFMASLTPKDHKDIWGQLQPLEGLPFALITPKLLRRYEQWMLLYGMAPRSKHSAPTPATLTSISIYCRNLRAVYNEAILAGVIAADGYPFGKKGYVIPASVNTKKALSKEEVRKIIDYAVEPDSMAARSKDFWVFSYLCNGMNFADMLHLRWKDLDLENKTLTFVRQKTTQTRKAKQVKITASLFEESLAILERWGNKRRSGSDYVFPYLEPIMDATRQRSVINSITKLTNKYMAEIGQQLGIQSEITTYAARHSFATILLRSEAPLAFISQSLGHTSIKTTQDYLGSFEDEQTKKYLSNLL
ncbi:site-specific integrase [Spirosoma flavus]